MYFFFEKHLMLDLTQHSPLKKGRLSASFTTNGIENLVFLTILTCMQ